MFFLQLLLRISLNQQDYKPKLSSKLWWREELSKWATVFIWFEFQELWGHKTPLFLQLFVKLPRAVGSNWIIYYLKPIQKYQCGPRQSLASLHWFPLYQKIPGFINISLINSSDHLLITKHDLNPMFFFFVLFWSFLQLIICLHFTCLLPFLSHQSYPSSWPILYGNFIHDDLHVWLDKDLTPHELTDTTLPGLCSSTGSTLAWSKANFCWGFMLSLGHPTLTKNEFKWRHQSKIWIYVVLIE